MYLVFQTFRTPGLSHTVINTLYGAGIKRGNEETACFLGCFVALFLSTAVLSALTLFKNNTKKNALDAGGALREPRAKIGMWVLLGGWDAEEIPSAKWEAPTSIGSLLSLPAKPIFFPLQNCPLPTSLQTQKYRTLPQLLTHDMLKPWTLQSDNVTLSSDSALLGKTYLMH